MDGLSGPIVASFEALVADVTAGRLDSPALREGLAALFPERDAAEETAYHDRFTTIGWRDRTVVAVEADARPELNVEDEAPVALDRVSGTRLWVRSVPVEPGIARNFAIRLAGRAFGSGISPHALTGYPELSHPLPDAPAGTLSERRTVTSAVYDGAEVPYWTYANAGIDTERGAPVMIWLDGQIFVGQADALSGRLQTVTDNLVHRGLIPPMVHVLLSSGTGGTRVLDPDTYHTGTIDMRVHQFDEVSEEFNRHLLGEVLPDVARTLRLRPDGYSRGIFGGSSGGTAAFKVGWYAPDAVSRLYPYLASFDAWGWRPADGVDGGQVLPLWVRRGPRKNLRVWLSAGRYDDFDEPIPAHLAIATDALDQMAVGLRRAGSQALGQFEMVQALKVMGYDFHFRYGATGHDFVQAASELPEALAWLWRDYDPDRTDQVYEPDEAERARPPFRFGVLNRDTW